MFCLKTIWMLLIGVMLGGYLAIAPTEPIQEQAQTSEAPRVFEVSPQTTGSGPASISREQVFFRNGRMTGKLVFWNDQPWERTLFEYMDELSLYSVKTMVYHGDKVSVVRKDLFELTHDGQASDRRIETWYYHFDKDRANALRQVDTYYPHSTLVRERQMFDESGALRAGALFEYDPGVQTHEPDENEAISSLIRMTLLDDEGEVVSDYREREDIDLAWLYRDSGLSDSEIGRRLTVSRDPSRIPVLVMDGGVDISHPDLAYKLWKNPNETANGLDDDDNGLTDDVYGISDNPRLTQPVFDLRLPRFGLPTLSHGTLVASIVAQDREDAAIMSVSEMTTVESVELVPRIERLIKSHGVRFTNMSFIFDKQLLALGPHAQRPLQIRELIENTPDTLHVVAAGNGAPISGKGFDVDAYRQTGDLVPAMLPQENILVVGALDTDRLELGKYPDYRLAAFSNVGEQSVDILAPGTRMCGARMGGGTVCDNGTSFAAPYVLNHGVLEVVRINHRLSIYEIKELLMKSAYVPDLDHPFPVRSGGILHPARAKAAAQWLLEHPEASVESAIMAVRRSEANPMVGEENSDSYLSDLQAFWVRRQIMAVPSWYAMGAGSK